MLENLNTLCEHVVNLGYLIIVIYPSQVCRPNHKPTSIFSVKNVRIECSYWCIWTLEVKQTHFDCTFSLLYMVKASAVFGIVIDLSLSHVK